MLLKHTYQNDTDIPAEAKPWYAEGDDGRWVLQVEGGMVPASTLADFRKNNRDMFNKLKAFEGLDPEQCRALLARAEELEEGKIIKKDGVEAVIKQRLDKVHEEHGKALKTLEERANAAEARYSALAIERHVLDAAIEAGLHRNAVADFMNARVQREWKLVDGKPVAIDEDGNERYGASGGLLPVKEWLAEKQKQAPHFFAQNQGSGAGGSPQGRSVTPHNGVNPWMKGAENITLQHRIKKENPALAERLMASARGFQNAP